MRRQLVRARSGRPTWSGRVVDGAFLLVLALATGSISFASGGSISELPRWAASWRSVDDRVFVATSATDNGGERELLDDVVLDFRRPRFLAVGTGCNGGSGTARIEGARLIVNRLISTAMGCGSAREQQEEFVLRFLEAKPTVRVDGDHLVLWSGNDRLRLVDRRATDPGTQLRTVGWNDIESVSDGQSSAAWAGRGSVGFYEGKVGVTTSCARLSGPVTLSGVQIILGPLSGQPRELPGPALCDADGAQMTSALLHVLDKPVTVEFVGQRTRLEAMDGSGITLVRH